MTAAGASTGKVAEAKLIDTLTTPTAAIPENWDIRCMRFAWKNSKKAEVIKQTTEWLARYGTTLTALGIFGIVANVTTDQNIATCYHRTDFHMIDIIAGKETLGSLEAFISTHLKEDLKADANTCTDGMIAAVVGKCKRTEASMTFVLAKISPYQFFVLDSIHNFNRVADVGSAAPAPKG